MAKQYWLMKSEPDAYAWDQLVKDGTGIWDGVRNHSAKLNMKAMKVGDEALFYHSNIGKECVGIMTITEEAFPDPLRPRDQPRVMQASRIQRGAERRDGFAMAEKRHHSRSVSASSRRGVTSSGVPAASILRMRAGS